MLNKLIEYKIVNFVLNSKNKNKNE